jgi:hypothetical protein
MKTYVLCLVLSLTTAIAHADTFDQRASADSAQREAEGRAYQASQFAYAQQTVGAIMARMAARHGGLRTWTPGITIMGGEVLEDPYSEMGFETNDGLACHPWMRNTDCENIQCSNIRLETTVCYDASGKQWEMDAKGGLKTSNYYMGR